MHRTLTVIVLLILSVSIIWGQCPFNVSLGTQAQVEEFVNSYPNCTEIEGSLTISSQVSDLSPLSNITSIGYGLTIQNNDALTDLSGLSGLQSVGTNLRINNCSALTGTQGLENLSSVGLDVSIKDCDNLSSLPELPALVTINNDLIIEENAGLASLQGFVALETVTRNVLIRMNGALTSAEGLDALTHVGGRISFSQCHGITSFNGFNSVLTVDGEVTVGSCDELVEMHGFEKIETIGEDIRIVLLPKLKDYSAFGNVKSVHNYFISTVNSIENINIGDVELITGSVFLGNRETAKTITGGDKLREVGGSLSFEGNMIKVLPEFPVLTNIGGSLTFRCWEGLEQITGFNNLETIGESFYVVQHNKIMSITGLNKLRSVGVDFEVRENPELIDISGLRSLESIGNNFRFWDNEKLNDCTALCDFMENGAIGGGSFVFANGENGGPCSDEEDIIASCNNPLMAARAFDANPCIDPELSNECGTDIRELSPANIVNLSNQVNGVAADGLSQAVIKLEFEEAGMIELMRSSAGIETPWGTATYEAGGVHYVFVLYSAPETFASETTSLYQNEVEAYTESIQVEFDNGTDRYPASFQLYITRPPVVLVHGTLSNPEMAWKTGAGGNPSLYTNLTNSGYKCFTTNYEATNGSQDPSSFEINKTVVWGEAGTGGIFDALQYYRDELSVAVTQADVVAHDMGGLLARVYASDGENGYNPDYKRRENYMDGDINRLITIATPHFGSEFREFQVFLENNASILSLPDFTLMDWLYQNALVFYYWYNGLYATEAIRDQLPPPGNEALAKIGPSVIPSHAITCRAPFGQGILKDPVYDPEESYYDLFWYTTLLLYNNKDVRDKYLDEYKVALLNSGQFAKESISGRESSEIVAAYEDIMYFKKMIDDGLWYAGQVMSIMDGTWVVPAGATILKYAFAEVGMSNYTDPLLEVVINDNLEGVVAGWIAGYVDLPTAEDAILTYLSTNDKSMEVIRSLIFNNDYNDGVVRVQSQTGGIDEFGDMYVTHLDTILHAFATQDPEVQNAVSTLLSGGMINFRTEGFPATDEPLMLYYPDSTLNLLSAETGSVAICRSGMVPSHAQAFAQVADRENTIIITRPVNPDGTPLIKCNAATKVMNVKPKSSNWGPQRGYLPQLQRYSKIWKIYEGDKRIENINKYDQKVEENLADGVTVAKHLQVSTCNEFFDVYIDRDEYTGDGDWENAEDEIVLVRMRGGQEEVCKWDQRSAEFEVLANTCRLRMPSDDLEPFMVMATPPVPEEDIPSISLTADYDLLMFGFYDGPDQGPPDPPENIPFDPERGQITPRQSELISKLNEEVKATGYTGGNVSHHGPENQFSMSPYIDYPVTVFAPGSISYGVLKESVNGKILSIPMGPPGFRDIHLKRFVNAMREQGYNLYDNPTAPGWHWTWNDERGGYDLEDSDMIGPYVEELKNPKCDKAGGTEKISGCACPRPPEPDVTNEQPQSWLTGFTSEGSDNGITSLSVYPNPVEDGAINIEIEFETRQFTSFTISDAFGNIVYTRNVDSPAAHFSDQVDVSSMRQGVYTVTVMPVGLAMRFIKI